MAGIRASLRKLLSLTGQRNAEVSVLLVGDTAMRSLNRHYRGKDRTTDVLSFPLREGRFGRIQPQVLGDIVLSLPAARRQAKAAGEPCQREIERLLVHGYLHLLGYDHERSRAEARRMDGRERRLREALHR
ncbi:MAG: rRNA maturation RNase YbeY [Nitrospirota bacterium]